MSRLRSAAAALALLVAAGAHAQQAGPPAWLGELDLSEAQQQQIFGIYYEQAPAIRERVQAARRAHEALENLAIAVRLESDAAHELEAAQAQALADVAHLRMDALVQVYQVLTAEQRARAVKLPTNYE